MSDDNTTRRSVLKTIGATGAVGALGAPASAAEAREPSVEKEPLPDARVRRRVRELVRTDEYREILERMQTTLDGDLWNARTAGSRLIGPEGKSVDMVTLDFENPEDVRSQIVWTRKEDQEDRYGIVQGSAADLTRTPQLLRRSRGVSTANVGPEQIRVTRSIEPEKDEATYAIVSEQAADKELLTDDDIRTAGTVDVKNRAIRSSRDDFRDCLRDNVDGKLPTGAACGACLAWPSPPTCIACATVGMVFGCQIGNCAGEHLSSTFCRAVAAHCVSPYPPQGTDCAVAFGCQFDCGYIN